MKLLVRLRLSLKGILKPHKPIASAVVAKAQVPDSSDSRFVDV